MSVHRIRLVGPWEFVWRTSTSESSTIAAGSESGTVKMPCDWKSMFGARGGIVAFSRRFHRPTNLDPHEKVFIVLDGVGGRGTIRLNGNLLLSFELADSTEADVTDKLQAFNCLEIELEHDPIDGVVGGLYAPIALEIRQS